MSYDLQIRKDSTYSESKAYQSVVSLLASFEGVKKNTFSPHQDYFASLFLEKTIPSAGYSQNGQETGEVNLVSIHVPYEYMNKSSTNPDIYYSFAQQIADRLNWQVFDPQIETTLDDLRFPHLKRYQLQTQKKVFTRLIPKLPSIELHNSWEKEPIYRLNLETFEISSTQQLSSAEPSSNTGFAVAELKSHLFALNYRQEKRIEIRTTSDTANLKKATSFLDIDLSKTKMLHQITKCGEVVKMRFIADDTYLLSWAYKSKQLKQWAVQTGSFVKNFTDYSRAMYDFIIINEWLVVTSKAGVSFFERTTGKLLITFVVFTENWLAFTPSGDYEFKQPLSGAVELDWIDNRTSTSYVFVPGLGFAEMPTYGPHQARLSKIKATRGEFVSGLLEKVLKK
jgi:hypothetical protein